MYIFPIIYSGWITMDCATIFNLFAATSALSVVILQLFPFPVTPSAAISSLSIDTNASTTLTTLSLVFFPDVLTSTLAPDTLAVTSLTRIVSAVALANLPLVIVTFSASIRQKSKKVQ